MNSKRLFIMLIILLSTATQGFAAPPHLNITINNTPNGAVNFFPLKLGNSGPFDIFTLDLQATAFTEWAYIEILGIVVSIKSGSLSTIKKMELYYDPSGTNTFLSPAIASLNMTHSNNFLISISSGVVRLLPSELQNLKISIRTSDFSIQSFNSVVSIDYIYVSPSNSQAVYTGLTPGVDAETINCQFFDLQGPGGPRNARVYPASNGVWVSVDFPDYDHYPIDDFKGVVAYASPTGYVNIFGNPGGLTPIINFRLASPPSSPAVLFYYYPDNKRIVFRDPINNPSAFGPPPQTRYYSIFPYDNTIGNMVPLTQGVFQNIQDNLGTRFVIEATMAATAFDPSIPVSPTGIGGEAHQNYAKITWTKNSDPDTLFYVVKRRVGLNGTPAILYPPVYKENPAVFFDTPNGNAYQTDIEYYYTVVSADSDLNLSTEGNWIRLFFNEQKVINDGVVVYGNSPNISNGEFVRVLINLTQSEHVKIVVYSLSGEPIKVLSNDTLNPGVNEFQWYGRNGNVIGQGDLVSPGLYFIHVQGKTINKIFKVILRQSF